MHYCKIYLLKLACTILIATFLLTASNIISQFFFLNSFQEGFIKPKFANFISKFKKVSSVTSRYNNSETERIFESPTFLDTILEAEKLDVEDDPENFELLRRDNQFNKYSTGIIYTGQMDPKYLTRDFCKILALK